MTDSLIAKIIDGRTDLVFEYVADGGDIAAHGPGGVTLIRWCAYYGDVSAIRFLISSGERLESLGSNFDLNGAAFHGHWQLCQYLIECGADVNRPLADTGETPLHAACSRPNRPQSEAVTSVLLQAGANPNVMTIPGVESGCFMRDARTSGETPLHRAAALASGSVIQQLLAVGATIDVRDSNGDSPLGWASWHCRPDSILRMLCFGEHRIHPEWDSQSDHGAGWSAMDRNLIGRPGA